MMNLEALLKKYDYEFPEELIARKPASPRDSARLLIYDRASKKTKYGTFSDLPEYLPENSVLVFNRTKVLPARLILEKPTGGKVRVIYLETVAGGLIRVMADRMIGIGSILKLAPRLTFIAVRQEEKFYYLKPSFPAARLYGVLEKYGITPIPPYIKNSPLKEKELREKYQTIFAKDRGSVAAPTASLHFSARLMERLKKSGVKIRFVTLHVGLGTFAPLAEENIRSGKLHGEYYEISRKDAEFLNKAKRNGSRIIAVGTTVARTLESAADDSGILKKLSGYTDIFIREGCVFKFTGSLITNFHVPKSSLMMLVSVFVGRENLLSLYREAIKRKFRLFSFGDGMLIL